MFTISRKELTQAQIDLAMYYRDAPGLPGYPGAGHFVAIFSQVLSKATPQLDIAALAYAKSGIGLSDALTICFINKYAFKLLRPITYIQNEMGYTKWAPLFGTLITLNFHRHIHQTPATC